MGLLVDTIELDDFVRGFSWERGSHMSESELEAALKTTENHTRMVINRHIGMQPKYTLDERNQRYVEGVLQLVNSEGLSLGEAKADIKSLWGIMAPHLKAEPYPKVPGLEI